MKLADNIYIIEKKQIELLAKKLKKYEDTDQYRAIVYLMDLLGFSLIDREDEIEEYQSKLGAIREILR